MCARSKLVDFATVLPCGSAVHKVLIVWRTHRHNRHTWVPHVSNTSQADQPAVPGGKRIHFLAPLTTAFHAHVALGSTWKEEPDLWGPMISHLRVWG
jgi:hypothetical protein